MSNFDIIGDIHGNHIALINLLDKLGYKKDSANIYYHPNRQVVFLGDFIDRIQNQAKVINIIKPMVEKKYAFAIMGNHEFNAICFHTKLSKTDLPLRKHSEKNVKQHKAFLDEFPLGDKKTTLIINWFKTLPIFLEFEKFRVIHACWNSKDIQNIKPLLKENNQLTNQLLIKASKYQNKEFDILGRLLKGVELKLPKPHCFLDKDGNKRNSIRVKWWDVSATTFLNYSVNNSSVPDISLPANLQKRIYEGNKPVLFGHYWFSSKKPKSISPYFACLDFSAGKGDKLVAYQWNKGDELLSDENFIFVDAKLN